MARILLRGDTAANWTSANPVLLNREIGLDMTTSRFKIGDGVKTWTQLAYAAITNDASALTTGLLSPQRIGDGSIEYGKLASGVLPTITSAVIAAIGSGGGGAGGNTPDSKVAARLSQVKTVATAGIFAGSSSTERYNASAPEFRFVNRITVGLQLSNPSGRPSGGAQSLETYVLNLPGGAGGFTTTNTMPGFHGYNVGKAGTNSSNFILNADIPKLCVLNPAFWAIMVGSNDAVDGITPANYKSNLLGKIALIKANMPAGASYAIYLIHQYLRPASRNPAYPWSDYANALAEIAVGDPTLIRFIDLSNALPNVPGPDNATALATGDIDSDLIHMTDQGHGKWAAAEFSALFSKTLPAGSVVYSPIAPPIGNDNFDGRTSTTELGNGWVSSNGTWGVTADGKAYLVSGTNGVATKAVGLTNGEITADITYPGSGFIGLRGRVTGAGEAVSFYIDRANSTANLSTIINSSNALLATGVAVPSGIANGQAVNLKLVMDNEVMSGYINNTWIMSASLTPQQMATIDGSGIGLRQTVSGTANGTFDNVAWTNVITSTPGSGGGGGGGGGGGTGTALASDTFAGTAGSGWSSQWVSSYGTGDVSTINGSNQGVLTTPATAYGLAKTEYLSGMVASADTEVTYDVGLDGTLTEQYFRVSLRSPGTIDTGTGNAYSSYEVSINPAGTTINLVRRSAGGGATTLGTFPWTFVANQRINVRFQAVGSDIRFRAWVNGTSEPTTWGVAVKDYEFPNAGKVLIRYQNGNSATVRNATIDNLVVSVPSTGTGGGSQIVATANTPMPTEASIPGWDRVAYNDFLVNVAQGSSAIKTAYPDLATYNGFGDTAWKRIKDREGIDDPGRSAWYSDKSLWVENSQLVCDVGWDAAVGRNLTSFILTNRYAGQVEGRVDFLLRSDVVMDYKIVPLWWSASNPDVWAHGEIDYPESNHLGTTFKAYVHNTLGQPKLNVKAMEPILFPGNSTPPRLDSWHVFSQQWTNAEISFWLDGIKVFSLLRPSDGNGFPTMPMRFGFQIEALDLDGYAVISKTAKGQVRIGWYVQYTRNAATAV